MMATIKGYLLGGVAIAALSSFGWLLWQNGNLRADLSASRDAEAQATSQRDELIKINEQNTQALLTLAHYRVVDNELLVKLQADFAKWDEKLEVSAKNREQLKRTNQDVKDFLNMPIPAPLRMPK